jgi:host factor-I protein
MSKGNVNLQDSFLNQVRKDNIEVKITLLDGTMLRGVVRGFDNFTLILHVGGMQHLIYKHAVAQIVARRMPPKRDDKERGGDTEAADGSAKQSAPFNKLDLSAAKAALSETAPESAPAPQASTD